MMSATQPPNTAAHPCVIEITATDLDQRIRSGELVNIYDVRTFGERQLAKLSGTTLLNQETHQIITNLDEETPLVFH